MSFSYSIEREDDKGLILLKGKLMERQEAELLSSQLYNLMQEGVCLFAINLKSLEYLNSTGFNVLLRLLTKVRNTGGEIVLFNISDQLNKLILLTKLDSLFIIASNKNEAYTLLDQKFNSKK